MHQLESGKIHLSKLAFDKALDLEASKHYNLSIQLSLDGFSFCIYDNQRNKYSGIGSWYFQDISSNLSLSNLLSDFIPTVECLNKKFEQTYIIFESPVSTIIPKPLYQPEEAVQYLKFNHRSEPHDQLKSEFLPLLDSQNIWAIPQCVQQVLSAFFPKASLHHYASTLIEALLLQNKNRDTQEAVFVNVRKNWFDIVVLKGNSLLFFNTFKYSSKEDFIYFLIFVLEQLNLNPEKIDVVLLGEILKISSVYEMTYKYVRNISFGKRNINHQFSYIFDDIPEHFYFNLIHLQQCGL